MSTLPRPLLRLRNDEAAQQYLRGRPLEYFMEAVSQSEQPRITVVSFDLVHIHLPHVQTFSELLLQYRLGKKPIIHQVIPHNVVFVHPEPLQVETSYDLELQPEVLLSRSPRGRRGV